MAKKVQKSVMHVQSCFFLINPLLFAVLVAAAVVVAKAA